MMECQLGAGTLLYHSSQVGTTSLPNRHLAMSEDIFCCHIYRSYWQLEVRGRCCCRSVPQSCSTLCDPMDCSMPGLPVPLNLLESAQVHIHCIGDAIQPSHPLVPSSLSALNLSQHQGFFQWVSHPHQMTKVLELQLQRQPFQWVFRVDFP